MSEPTPSAPRAKLITYVLARRAGAEGPEVLLVRYARPPNPRRDDAAAWWVPSPELAFGDVPGEAAARVVADLGLGDVAPQLVSVDAFTTRDWHVLFLYVAEVGAAAGSGPAASADRAGAAAPLAPDLAEARWFPVGALPPAAAFAHGDWERRLVASLAAAPTRAAAS